jgi:hypothetical protein
VNPHDTDERARWTIFVQGILAGARGAGKDYESFGKPAARAEANHINVVAGEYGPTDSLFARLRSDVWAARD